MPDQSIVEDCHFCIHKEDDNFSYTSALHNQQQLPEKLNYLTAKSKGCAIVLKFLKGIEITRFYNQVGYTKKVTLNFDYSQMTDHTNKLVLQNLA